MSGGIRRETYGHIMALRRLGARVRPTGAHGEHEVYIPGTDKVKPRRQPVILVLPSERLGEAVQMAEAARV